MTVEQHAAGQLSGDVDHQQRSQSRESLDLDFHTGDRLCPAPVGHELDRRVHVTVAFPLRVEHLGFVRNPDIRLQSIDDGLIPDLIDERLQAAGIHEKSFKDKEL